MPRTQIPVLIAGGGTVGLAAAALLGHHGVAAALVERHAGPSIHPRAAGVGVRTMEIFRGIGLEAAIRAAAAPLAGKIGWISVETLAAADLPRVSAQALSPALAVEASDPFSPTTGLACAQDVLDPILSESARRCGTALQFNTELVALEQDATGVTATLVNRGTGEAQSVRADYLIAADGAASLVRRTLGISTTGPGALNAYLINVLFEADLSTLVGEHPFMLCEIRAPQSSGMFIRVRDSHRWVYHFTYDPARGESPEDYPPERCCAMIRAAIGVSDFPVEIVSILPWQVAASVADRFRQERIFLVGDAAHVVPPTGGYGMNTGIADAHNLAWKLALVLAGRANVALLDTYEEERCPVARFTMEQALLRLKHPQLHWDTSRVTEREQLGIANQQVVHLGYHYVSNAIVGPRRDLPSLEHLNRDLDGSPGTRAPHLWVGWRGERASTLDMIGTRFTLLAGPDGADWCVAARAVAARVGIEVAAYRIGAAGDALAPEGDWLSAAGIGADGALLVRPDGFVAWRGMRRVRNLSRTLARVLEQLLGQAPTD